MSHARGSPCSVYLPLLQPCFPWNRRKSVYFLTNKLTLRGCAASHRNCNSQSRIHPKNVSSKQQLFPETCFVHIKFKTTLWWGCSCLQRSVWGSPGAPSRPRPPSRLLPRLLPATTLALHPQELSSADQTRFSSQSFTAGSTFQFPYSGGFLSCRRKASLTGFLLINPRVRDRVIPVSIWPPSPASTWFLPVH